MKHYQITFNVPDDFNPDEMELNASYKDDITIFSEGFEDILSKMPEFLSKYANIDKLKVDEKDVILVYISKECYEAMPDSEIGIYMSLIKKSLEDAFNCPVLVFVNDLEILVQNANQAIDMFNGMIAKVKVRAAINDTSKIILPK